MTTATSSVSNNTDNSQLHDNAPTIFTLSENQTAGHGDHWSILTDDIGTDVPNWLQKSIDTAAIPTGLTPQNTQSSANTNSHLLLSDNQLCHINQVLAMQDGKPKNFVNAYPCVNSPYGLKCKIERIVVDEKCHDAVLNLVSEDGTRVYAFDQLYTINAPLYRSDVTYFINFSAWAYEVCLSDQDEVVRVEDPEAIRYHRAFNDIVAANDGIPPDDIEAQIEKWQPSEAKDGKTVELAPVEINLGHMCAYLYGETLGQEDEAWCQGQVLGMQHTQLYGQDITVFDVAILREPDATPFVVRIASPSQKVTQKIEVHDYIQANIWLQAAIYYENQDANRK